jgi:protein phosphatase
MRIRIPDPCLVLLIGSAGAGKSTFARRHFKPTEVLSSDFFRALLSDDENDQAVSRDAFDLLAWVAERRLARDHLTVVDATNTTRERRKPLLALACRCHVPVVALVFDLPLDLCVQRDRQRPERTVSAAVIARQYTQLRRSLARLTQEGVAQLVIFNTPAQVESARIVRQRR